MAKVTGTLTEHILMPLPVTDTLVLRIEHSNGELKLDYFDKNEVKNLIDELRRLSRITISLLSFHFSFLNSFFLSL